MQVISPERNAMSWQGSLAPTVSHGPQAQAGYLGRLDWMLGRLSIAHVRITLVRLTLPPGACSRTAAQRIAEALDDAYGLAGTLADGSVMAAFFGPRRPGAIGDRQQNRAILRRLSTVLRDAEVDRQAADVSVHLIHRWTDEIGDVATLVLDSTPARAGIRRLDPALS